MHYPYIIIDDDQESFLKTKAIADGFSDLVFVASANNYSDGLNLILEHNPKLIFLEIDPSDKTSNLSLALINELYRYLNVIPKIVITTRKKEMAYEAIQYDVLDYLIKPVQRIDFIKLILKIKKSIIEEVSSFVVEKPVLNEPQASQVKTTSDNYKELKVEEMTAALVENPVFAEETILDEETTLEETTLEETTLEETTLEETITLDDTSELEETNTLEEPRSLDEPITLEETSTPEEVSIPEIVLQKPAPIIEQPLILCIKSYGDYRYIDANDICYFQADNNSTDIHLNNGEMVTAFKTLKHFEGVLPYPFARIHNSYIVNRDYISRIHTGNAVCYIKNSTTKLPFSKSYKENVDEIISDFANGNYLEI